MRGWGPPGLQPRSAPGPILNGGHAGYAMAARGDTCEDILVDALLGLLGRARGWGTADGWPRAELVADGWPRAELVADMREGASDVAADAEHWAEREGADWVLATGFPRRRFYEVVPLCVLEEQVPARVWPFVARAARALVGEYMRLAVYAARDRGGRGRASRAEYLRVLAGLRPDERLRGLERTNLGPP
jgi:hypothetical protein